jgi:hypothetical protein
VPHRRDRLKGIRIALQALPKAAILLALAADFLRRRFRRDRYFKR